MQARNAKIEAGQDGALTPFPTLTDSNIRGIVMASIESTSPPTFAPRSKRIHDLTNQTFGRYRVLGYCGKSRTGQTLWYCQCVCGNIRSVQAACLKNGKSKSCGCIPGNLTHGETRGKEKSGAVSPELAAFYGARGRCRVASNRHYRLYGGRGIEFRFETFEEFIAEVGRRPSTKHSLDRIDVNGHYEPGNLRWATQTMPCRNRQRSVNLTINGSTKHLYEWAEEVGIPENTLRRRSRRWGWCDECCLTVPAGTRRHVCGHK